MHLIRRLTTSFKLVLGNTPIIDVPVYTIAYYVALGNMGTVGGCVWHTRVYHFICCRLLCTQAHSSTQGFITEYAYLCYGVCCVYFGYNVSCVSGVGHKKVIYPIGTHIPLK